MKVDIEDASVRVNTVVALAVSQNAHRGVPLIDIGSPLRTTVKVWSVTDYRSVSIRAIAPALVIKFL